MGINMERRIFILCVGCLLDLLFGDPHFLWHPVRGIGKVIELTEKGLRKLLKISPEPEADCAKKRAAGGLLVLVVLGVTLGVTAGVLVLAGLLHPYVRLGLECILCYQMLAMKSLKAESMKVYHALKTGDMQASRYAVSMIVGRDTETLDEAGVTRAAVETVAENTSDGVIAPLLYIMCFGVLGGVLYKAVNTMDSMVGYQNDKYRYLGTAAAKLDDVCNFLPARIAALFMILAAFLLGMDGKGSARIWKRDRYCHASPNSAQTESVCAGALRVRLAGDAWYFGVLHKKPFIGDDLRPVEPEDIRRANRLLYMTSFLVFAAGLTALIGLCVCGRNLSEAESALEETEESVRQEESRAEEAFPEKYEAVFEEAGAKRVALVYLDEDAVPELLLLKDGEYRLYSFDGSEVKAVAMPDAEIKANAYGPGHSFEEREQLTFYWFEYVPYKGLIRVHGGTEQGRRDAYLRYTDGFLETALEAESVDYTWQTYDAEKEITNEEFLSRLSDLGYHELIPCGYLYENVATAYENIDTASDTKKVLEDFVNGKIGGLDYVEKIEDIPEDGFVMRSYEDFYNDITEGEDFWEGAKYIDFDNDGEEELIISGYARACLFFDVVGGTVYKVLETGSTTDFASVAEMEGKRVIERADFLYVGRKNYEIMTYDACCCVIDWFRLYAAYEGETISEDDRFMYRNREISMEEFETILDSIRQP